ncbi:MAG: hypothetical protein UV33_C0026G0001, partial [Candidatus Daviesbacteria bacterium GW2011_GWA1_42_6]
ETYQQVRLCVAMHRMVRGSRGEIRTHDRKDMNLVL